MKKITLTLSIMLLMMVSFAASAQGIVINEVLAANNTVNTDEDNSYQDWVELYNNGPSTVNLSGYGLTDDSAALFKWVFPNVSLAPGQYMLVWCSDKNRTTPGSPLHTNFKISSSGETISLTNPGGTVVNSAPATALADNVSLGRIPNGTGNFEMLSTVTPAAANQAGSPQQVLAPPTFSHEAGFQTAAFNLVLSSTEPGSTILYTLDGSDPEESSIGGTTYTYKNQYAEFPGQTTGPLLTQSYQTLSYTGPINIIDRSPQPNKIASISSTYSFDPSYYIPPYPIFKGTVVRAKVVKPGFVSSPIVTKTYMVSPQGSSRFALPVLSLSFTETKFFDYNEGIYVAGIDYDNWRALNPTLFPRGRQVGNYYRRGMEHEKQANFSYFVNGTEVINQDVGIRIRGASTRRYESKSLTVYARGEYGDGTLNYQFFPDLQDNAFKRLTLSNSGSDFRDTMFRDALVHEIAKSLNSENENYRPVVTLFNGEFWGILNIRERYDNEYFQRVYGFSNVDLLENQGLQAEEGDVVHYQAMINFLQNNSLAVPENFQYIKTQMDPESFTDNWITSIFMDNSDWPGNNVQMWRKRTESYVPNAPYGHDGRWRWVFHDLDDTFSFGTDDYNHNNLAVATTLNTTWPNPAWSTLIIRKLLENETYKNDFINRFADLMNTVFLPERIISIMNTMKTGIESTIPEHINRWRIPSSVNSWNSRLTYQTNFANARPAFQRNHIREKFNIDSNINATLNVSNAAHGYIKINTIEIKNGTPGILPNPYPWTGVYFSGIPVKLKAVPMPGFAFSHWTGASTSTDAEIVITSAQSFAVTAVFVTNEPSEISEPIYFWMMNADIPNDTPLVSLNSTYEWGADGVIQYQSSLAGYPFAPGHPNWRKASMERRNAPTPINYRPEANGGAAYAPSAMRGLQVLQPFQQNGLENTMFFNFSTVGYKDIKFSFAAKDEGAASGIKIDYSVNVGDPVWISTGLAATNLPLTAAYSLFEVNFSSISAVQNNPNFKIRLRFTGSNMTADTGARVTFNNFALDGVKMPLTYPTPHVFTEGTAIAPITPTISGGTALSFSVSPALPAGLILNTTTGVISGTPTNTSASSNYTITAQFSGGSSSFPVNITVNPAAPSGLSYTTPNVFTAGVAITPLTPTVTGGSSSTYSVSPQLPSGLTLNAATGVISGTPTVMTAAANYTVTATNVSGNTTFAVSIAVNDAPPSALTYNSPNTFTVGSAITNLNPTSSGGQVVSYSVSPGLPQGLTLNTTTGVISGTPVSVSPTATYTITATNSGGTTSFGISITINDNPPSGLTYSTPNIFTVGASIAPLTPSVNGGAVTSYSVSPSLPQGLTINTQTGVISGMPTSASSTQTYTVTATNSGGTASFGVQITVNDQAPEGLSYPSPNVFTVGQTITALNPTITGTADSYSVSPSLPAGLTLNTSTGVISGTPTAVTSTASYLVTANNTGGNNSFNVVITVNAVAPSGLSYPSPNTFAVGTAISPMSPSVSGGTVTDYSVSPALPAGLTLNTSTGVISGTPAMVTSTSGYTVNAHNSGGDATFTVIITVNDTPPMSLSYNSPNQFTINTPISALQPTSAGGAITAYAVSPSLPAGLHLNEATGVITGTPTTLSASTVYTVTGSNSGGQTTFNVTIAVNDMAPSSLQYPTPNVFTINTPVNPLVPTVSGGAVTIYTVSPGLPAGLTLNASTGVISGTPTSLSGTNTFTITATNSGGSTSFQITITVNMAAPQQLSYSTPNIFTVGSAITTLTPTVTGTVTNYSVTPGLPAGLSINASTGVISGTPTAVSPQGTYTVTATNSGGTTSFDVVITVNEEAPAITYPNPTIITVGTPMSPLSPTVVGNAVSFSIFPPLPAGLNFNTQTGVISGTPVNVTAVTNHTVTVYNSGGQDSFDVSITVTDFPPTGLSYNSPNTFTVGGEITPLFPVVTGNVTDYSSLPELPSGLTLDPATGEITGTPTVASAMTNYTITAANSGGFTTFDIAIEVMPGFSFTYNPINVYTVGNEIAPLTPNTTGSAASYSVSPALPAGLSFNPATGVISGTPTTVSTGTYTVTAIHSLGTSTFDISITVNDVAPIGLSYPSPNVFVVGSEISTLTPTVQGNVTSYEISPDLPAGLVFNAATGQISGTPTSASATSTYMVTAMNSGGISSFGVVITINQMPFSFSYNSSNVYTVGEPITPLMPEASGPVNSYSVSPALPQGLSINAATGAISGTPTAITATATYTITAVHSQGSSTTDIFVTVNDVPPSGLTYTSPNVFIVGTAITDLIPVVQGNVISFSISPSLPEGLFFDTTTGVISGTPVSTAEAGTYTVTAFNSGGASSFDVIISVDPQLGAGNVIQNLVKVYPNPFTDVVNIGGITEEITYSIYSAEGKRIQSGVTSGGQIMLRELPHGMYTVQLEIRGYKIYRKIIKD